MARDGENFLMCFLANWTSSFEKTLFSSFACFLLDCWIINKKLKRNMQQKGQGALSPREKWGRARS
jgi:hypothetical protein